LQVLQQSWYRTFSVLIPVLDSDREGTPARPLNNLKDISNRDMVGLLTWTLRSFPTE